MKPSFEQAAAAATLEQFAHDLLTWATQPAEALPEAWRAAYQDRLNEVAALVRRAFAEDRQVLAKLREVESEARDFIGILAANPAIATKPVSEWEVLGFRETFERLAAGRRWFADRVRVLDAEDDTQRGRQQSREDAAGIDRNPFEKAQRVLSEFAWIEGVEPPFDPAGVAFDPAAVQAWGFCVDAVAALPECSGGMMGISRRLQLRFDGTHSSPAGGGSAGIIWRWENAPSGPWVNLHELQALKIAGAEWDRQQSRAASAVAAVETEKQPAGPAIVEAPQPSPQGAAGPQPGSTPSASAAGAAAPQGASVVVEWSKPRSRKVWLRLLGDLEDPPFTGETAWKTNVRRDPASFSGPANHRRITRAKAEEWGLSLPEFDRSPK